MTGASSADSRMSVIDAPSSSSSSSTASATASSSRLMRPIRPAMSSGEATAGRTSWPVMSLRSSSASTFAGSAMATSRAPSSPNPIGTASKRRAAWGVIRFTADRSGRYTCRSTWNRPKRSAIARAS